MQKFVLAFTSFDTNDSSSKAKWNREALSHIDHTVKQMILCIRIWNDTELLLQRLHTHTHTRLLMCLKCGHSIEFYCYYIQVVINTIIFILMMCVIYICIIYIYMCVILHIYFTYIIHVYRHHIH